MWMVGGGIKSNADTTLARAVKILFDYLITSGVCVVCSTILVIVILYQRYWANTSVPMSHTRRGEDKTVNPSRLTDIKNIESQAALAAMVAPRLKHSVRLDDLELE